MASRFSSDEATAAIFRYSLGIPRVINLLCEHCLVSAFVDQKKMVTADIVDSVARDFDLADGNAGGHDAAPRPPLRKSLIWWKLYALWQRWPTGCANPNNKISPRKGNYEPYP